VRQSWADMPTAWALEKLIDKTGIENARELSDLTGLSLERLKRLEARTGATQSVPGLHP